MSIKKNQDISSVKFENVDDKFIASTRYSLNCETEEEGE
jgi:hypothetical protein